MPILRRLKASGAAAMTGESKFDRYLEKRAEALGLPTDPEAYQDGGLTVAATARNLPEADTLAAVLNANDVPAWVDSPLSALYSDGYQRPRIAVLVPFGRLADAQRLLAEHGAKEKPADEPGEPPGLESVPNEPATPRSSRPIGRIFAAVFLLVLGFCMLPATAALVREVINGPLRVVYALGLAACGMFGVGLCVAGIIGLRSAFGPDKQK